MGELARLQGLLSNASANITAAKNSIAETNSNLIKSRDLISKQKEFDCYTDYFEFLTTTAKVYRGINGGSTVSQSNVSVSNYSTNWFTVSVANNRPSGTLIVNLSSQLRYLNGVDKGVRLDICYGSNKALDSNGAVIAHTQATIEKLYASNGMRLSLGQNYLTTVNPFKRVVRHPLPDNQSMSSAIYARLIMVAVGSNEKLKLNEALLSGGKIYFKSITMWEGLGV